MKPSDHAGLCAILRCAKDQPLRVFFSSMAQGSLTLSNATRHEDPIKIVSFSVPVAVLFPVLLQRFSNGWFFNTRLPARGNIQVQKCEKSHRASCYDQ